jgi:hypothetical protein
MLVTVTVAFGITAPEASFTVPLNAPVVADWPMSTGAKVIEIKARAIQLMASPRQCQNFNVPCGMHPPFEVGS